MNGQDILTMIVTVLVSIGGWAGLSSFIKSFAENKKVKAESNAIGAKTPLEAESISVGTMNNALIAANGQIDRLLTENEEIRARLDHVETRQEEERELSRFLRRALGAAHDYIETLLHLIARTAPDAIIPKPQESYDFPDKEGRHENP